MSGASEPMLPYCTSGVMAWPAAASVTMRGTASSGEIWIASTSTSGYAATKSATIGS